MTAVTLRIYGIPMPQGSKTAFVRGGSAVLTDGRNAQARSAHAAWRQAVATAARDHLAANPDTRLIDTPCAVAVTFLLLKPSSSPKKRRYPDTRPDLDKLVRSVLDALADGGLLANDSRVVDLQATKRWAQEDDGTNAPPGALVTIQPLDLLLAGPPGLPTSMRCTRAC